MPTTNIYYKNNQQLQSLQTVIPDVKSYLAELLTCGEISLKPEEISVRFIQTRGEGMIGEVELEITAHAFPERIQKQDEICLNVRKYVMKNVPVIGEVKVWLILSELGHSWE